MSTNPNAISPLRRRMIEDMTIRRFTEKTQGDYIKGRKDRYVMLSPDLLDILRAWWRVKRPRGWLFPGQQPSDPLTARQLNRVVHAAATAAGLTKRVSMHTLRHSFAIRTCRTAALGGHVARCSDCAHTAISYNSCRNRHCPKWDCPGFDAAGECAGSSG